MEDICLNCKHCIWKYDMYLCMKENMPEPVTSSSSCEEFEGKSNE